MIFVWDSIECHVMHGMKPNNEPNVILPLMMSGFLRISANAANGMPQFATGPQKCVLYQPASQFAAPKKDTSQRIVVEVPSK